MWTAILLILEKVLELAVYLLKRHDNPVRKKEQSADELAKVLADGDTAIVDSRLTRALTNVRRKRKRLPSYKSGDSSAGDKDSGHGQDPV